MILTNQKLCERRPVCSAEGFLKSSSKQENNIFFLTVTTNFCVRYLWLSNQVQVHFFHSSGREPHGTVLFFLQLILKNDNETIVMF